VILIEIVTIVVVVVLVDVIVVVVVVDVVVGNAAVELVFDIVHSNEKVKVRFFYQNSQIF